MYSILESTLNIELVFVFYDSKKNFSNMSACFIATLKLRMTDKDF